MLSISSFTNYLIIRCHSYSILTVLLNIQRKKRQLQTFWTLTIKSARWLKQTDNMTDIWISFEYLASARILIKSSVNNLSWLLLKWNQKTHSFPNLFLYKTLHVSGSLSTHHRELSTFAFLFRIPMFIVHLWLPKAHVKAPVSGSMILAGVLLKLGGYGLLRVFPVLFEFGFRFGVVWVSLSLVGGLFVSLLCIRQTDLKSLIAYSSVAHTFGTGTYASAEATVDNSWRWVE